MHLIQTCVFSLLFTGTTDGGWNALGAHTSHSASEHVPIAIFPKRSKQAAMSAQQEAGWYRLGTEQPAAVPVWDVQWNLSKVEEEKVSLPQIAWDNRISQGRWPWQDGYRADLALGIDAISAPAHYTDALREQGMLWASAKGDGGENSTGWRAWKQFCADEGQSVDRPLDPMSTPLWVMLREEQFAMQYCCALVQNRGVAIATVKNYFGHVQTRHRRKHGIKLAAGLRLERLPEMMKGLARIHTTEPREIRRGVSPQDLRSGMDKLLDPRVPAHANLRAALSCALQGLMRSAEYAINPGTRWRHDFHLNRADVKRLDDLMLVLWIHPCKNMLHIGDKTCPLIIGAGGEYIDAVAEMRNLMKVDPSADKAEYTPLFRNADGSAITTDLVLAWIKKLMNSVGENPAQFGTHSLRIGGATALFAAGADPTVIRTMGRWSSDLYKLYVRACFEKSMEWSRRAGSTVVHDIAGVTFDPSEVADY